MNCIGCFHLHSNQCTTRYTDSRFGASASMIQRCMCSVSEYVRNIRSLEVKKFHVLRGGGDPAHTLKVFQPLSKYFHKMKATYFKRKGLSYTTLKHYIQTLEDDIK